MPNRTLFIVHGGITPRFAPVGPDIASLRDRARAGRANRCPTARALDSIRVGLTGTEFQAAVAFERPCSQQATVVSIVAETVDPNDAQRELVRRFPRWRVVVARSSSLAEDVGRTALHDVLAQHDTWYLGPSLSNGPIARWLLDEAKRCGARVYWAIGPDAMVGERAMREMTRVDWVQIRKIDLMKMTGGPDAVSGVNALREAGVRRIIVTDGPRGVIAFADGRWVHERGYRIDLRRDWGADARFSGTFLAAYAKGRPFGESVQMANASAAMHVAMMDEGSRRRTFEALLAFSRHTPRRPVQATRERRAGARVRTVAFVAFSVAAIVLIVVLLGDAPMWRIAWGAH